MHLMIIYTLKYSEKDTDIIIRSSHQKRFCLHGVGTVLRWFLVLVGYKLGQVYII